MGAVTAGRHGHFQDPQGLAPRVFGLFQAIQIFPQRGVVGVLRVFFHSGDDDSGSHKAGKVVDVTIGVVTLQSIPEPDDLLHAEPVLQLGLDLGTRE